MKGPKCRVCGHEHWAREPHVISGVPVQPSRPSRCRACAEKDERIAILEAEVADLKAAVEQAKLVTALVTRNQSAPEVVTPVVTRNHPEGSEGSARSTVRRTSEQGKSSNPSGPKRDRAEYMRKRRADAKDAR